MRFKHKSLKKYFTFNMLIASVIPILLLAMFMIPIIEKYLLAEDTERNHILTISLSEDIHNILNIPTIASGNIYSQIYQNHFIKEEHINSYLETIVEHNHYYDSIMILDSLGRIKHINSSNEAYSGLDMSNESYYFEAAKTKRPYWSTIYYSTNTSHISVSYTHPVDEDFIVIQLNVSKIAEFAHKVKHLDNSYVEIMDQKGTYIAHADMNKVYERETSENYKEYIKVVSTEDHEVSIQYNGSHMLAHLIQLKDPKWLIAAIRPYSEITKPIRVITAIVSIGLVVSFGLVFLISFFTNKRWINAFIHIKNAILGKSKVDVDKSDEIQHFVELNEISDAFQETMTTITDRECKLKEIIENEKVISEISERMVSVNSDNTLMVIDEVLERLVRHTESVSYLFVHYVATTQSFICRSKLAVGDVLAATVDQRLHSPDFKEKLKHCIYNDADTVASIRSELLGDLVQHSSSYFKCIPINEGYVALIAIEHYPVGAALSGHQDLNDKVADILAISVEKSNLFEKMENLKNLSEKANLAKSRFLANMSHEIRTPMNGIIGMTQILELSELDMDQKESISIIKDSSRRMMTLMNNLLFITSIDQEDVPLSENEFNLSNLLSNVAKEYERDARIKNLSITIEVDPSLPQMLLGDSGKITIILRQLLDNAVKFTDNGGVHIKAERTASFDDERFRLTLSVRDTGIGIDSEDMPKLFDYFTQLDDSYTKKYQGAGLGLAICKKLAGLMDGCISVESAEGVGSTFTFTAEYEIASTSQKLHEAISDPIQVLVVDDDAASRKLLGTLCEKNGFLVSFAENGKIAVEKCQINQFSLIFMDIQMPEMDGVKALKLIRNVYGNESSKYQIIAVTAYALSGDREKFLLEGFDDYLSKPFSIESFTELLQQIKPLSL